MDNQDKNNPFASMFSENWMDSTTKFWENSFKLQSDAMESMSGFFNYLNTDATHSKTDSFLKMGGSINKFVFSFFSNPGNLSGFASASEAIPALAMNLANNLTASFSEIQGIIADKSSKLGSNFKDINMDEFNTGIFKIWKELYESDFQKFYNVPQLGIARNYQEQFNTAMDAGNRFFMAFSEFMNLLYIPVEKAGTSVVETYQTMVDEDKISDDPKAMYKLWIKTLEGFYMQLLQSEDYRRSLNSVITTHAEYKKAKGEIMNTCYQQLQIPTNKELDELYKEIYLLKKKLRNVEKEYKEIKSEIAKKAAAKPKTTTKTNKAKRPAKKKTASKTGKAAKTAVKGSAKTKAAKK